MGGWLQGCRAARRRPNPVPFECQQPPTDALVVAEQRACSSCLFFKILVKRITRVELLIFPSATQMHSNDTWKDIGL